MWERNLQDLIRGLRQNKKDESKFISQALNEIRQEIRSKDMELKASAVVKLTYLEMLGYDMRWASFYVVEVMSSAKFHLKSVGYLAATQSFEQDTDVLMLTTNLVKKDFNSTPSDVAVSLNGLSQFVTPDLARDLYRDVISMMNHSRAYIRKRAVLAIYRVILKHPPVLEHAFPRIREKLEDADTGVVSATVNVLCELARQNPSLYLPLAPQLFHIMKTSSNNWTLIKVIKLFGILSPHEPRLAKKLLPPIAELISTTPAISLLYECVHTCIIGDILQGASGYGLARDCVTRLAGFLEDQDQNLKYIALLALVKIVPSHPELVADHESKILASFEDQDISIRMRALDLVSAMVNQTNLQSIVQQLLSHLVKSDSSLPTATQVLASAATNPIRAPLPSHSSSYRSTLSKYILQIGSHDIYANITDFQWYLSVLIDLAYVSRAAVGPLIKDQLIDVAMRVRQIRPYAVQLCTKLLCDETFVNGDDNAEAEGSGCQEVLWAAAWICGEYCSEVPGTRKVIPNLLQPSVAKLPADIIAVYLHNAVKIFGTWAAELAENWDDERLDDVKEQVKSILSSMESFGQHEDIEVQERASNFFQLFTFIEADLNNFKPKVDTPGLADVATSAFDPVQTIEPPYPKSLYLLQPLFTKYPLNPVAPDAQKNVPVPEGLDLDAWINPAAKKLLLGEPEEKPKKVKKSKKRNGGVHEKSKKSRKGKDKEGEMDREDNGYVVHDDDDYDPDEVEKLEKARAERLERQRYDPYYISDNRPPPIDVDTIPIVHLEGLEDARNMSPVPSPSRSILQPVSASWTPPITYVVDRGGEAPQGSRSAIVSPSPLQGTPLRPASVPPKHMYNYDNGDTISRGSGTPEPIVVTRVKKKSSKKKRTQGIVPDVGSDTH